MGLSAAALRLRYTSNLAFAVAVAAPFHVKHFAKAD